MEHIINTDYLVEIRQWMNLAVLLALLVVSIIIAFSDNLLQASIFMSIFGLLMALVYTLLNAPDVAITEAAIGAGISSILFLTVLNITGESFKRRKLKLINIIIFVITTSLLLLALVTLPHWGSATSPAVNNISPYYIANTQPHMGFPNIVTGILASYRGFDTLGEVFVVFTALISLNILLLGSVVRHSNGKPKANKSA